MLPQDIFDHSKKIPYQTEESIDKWAWGQLQTATQRLLNHFMGSTATKDSHRTMIFRGGKFKKQTVTLTFTWNNLKTSFDLSCPYRECFPAFDTKNDLRVYTKDSLSNDFISTTIGQMLAFDNKEVLYRFLAKDFVWFNDNFSPLSNNFNPKIRTEQETNGIQIANNLLKGIFS